MREDCYELLAAFEYFSPDRFLQTAASLTLH